MITDSFEYTTPLKLVGGDRQIYHLTAQNITSYDSGVDTTINTGKATGDLYCSTIVSDTRLAFIDAALAGDKFVKVPRLDYREVAFRWQLQGVTGGDVPFVVGSNSTDVLVPGLNASKLGGFAAAQSLTVSTVAVRDSAGRLKVATPAADDDATPRSYVDSVATGFKGKADRKCCFTANWAAIRVSNVLTATANGSINSSGVVDGVTLAVNDLVLIPFQTTGADRGFYTCTDLGSGGTPAIFTRSTDADTDAEMTTGVSCLITEGTLYANNSFALATQGTIVLNTTSLTFVITSKPGNFTAGNGMVKVGLAFHAIQSTAYTAGGIVWANAASTLTMTAALAGLIYNDGAAGPKVVNALTLNALPRVSTSAPYLVDSGLIDDGTKITCSRNLEPTANTKVLGSSTIPWAETHTKDVRTYIGTSAGGAAHWKLLNTTTRWEIGLITAEGGSNAGCDLNIARFDNAGALIANAITVTRSSGLVTIAGAMTVGGAVTLSTFTTGSVVFASTAGLLSQDNANLFYTTRRLRVGYGAALGATSTANGWSVLGRNVAPHASTDDIVTDQTHASLGTQAILITSDSLRFHIKTGAVTAGASAAAEVCRVMSASGSFAGLGIGTTAIQGELDLGHGYQGRSLVWGGATGTGHVASIGTAFSSGALSVLAGLKCDRAADLYVASETSVGPRAGIRFDTDNITFFGLPGQAHSVGDAFSWQDYSLWKIHLTQGGLYTTRKAPTSTNLLDSYKVSQSGASYETGVGAHTAEWQQYVEMTSYPGASRWVLQKYLDGGGETRILEVADSGIVTIKGATPKIQNVTEVSTTGQASGQALSLLANGNLVLGFDNDNNTSGSQLLIQANGATVATLSEAAQLRLGDSAAATATLHLKAGVAAAAGAPLKFDSGTLLTTAEIGAMEYDGTHLWWTRNGGASPGPRRRSVGVGISVVIGDGTNSVITVTHDLGTRRIIPYVARVSDNQGVGAKVTFPTLNTCVVTFSFVPASSSYWISLISAPEVSGN